MLTAAAVDRARTYVATAARPLERARLRCLLDGTSIEELVDALRDFQVDDGGFGRALESDCRAPEASVLATLTALDILRMHEAPGDHPLVAQACDWLLAHVEEDDAGRAVWPFLPPSAQASPHAPWWDQREPGQLAATFDGFVANPGVAITAHLWRHHAAGGSVPAELLDRLTEQTRQVVRAGVAAEEVNAHDALAHFAGESATPADVRAEVVDYLSAVLPERVLRPEGGYTTYGIHPLWIAPSPTHPLAPVLASEIESALEAAIADQEPDGSWAPFWNWGGGEHAEAWRVAEPEWRGTLVVRNLAALTAYGRVSAD